jgi:RNA polymerase sigma factor (sigma-70 family)
MGSEEGNTRGREPAVGAFVGEDIVEELYARHWMELLSFERSFGPEDPADLVQETLLRAVGHRRTLANLPARARRRWLYTALRNVAIDRCRRHVAEAPFEEPDRIPSLDEFPDRIATTELVDRLQQPLRQAVWMRYWLGMNSTEIAHELGAGASTVRYWLATAREQIRRSTSRKE